MMTDDEVRTVADDVLREALGPSGFETVEIRKGRDHAGDPALFVTAHFKPQSGVTSGAATLKAHTALWTELLRRREERFPYLEFRYPDDELLVGDNDTGEA